MAVKCGNEYVEHATNEHTGKYKTNTVRKLGKCDTQRKISKVTEAEESME